MTLTLVVRQRVPCVLHTEQTHGTMTQIFTMATLLPFRALFVQKA